MRRLYAAAFAVGLSGCSDQVTGPPSTRDDLSPFAAKSGAHAPVVHIVYLVPADVRVRRDYVQNFRDAAVNLQTWYSDALGIGETFTLANPTVEVYRTDRTAAAYTTTPVPGADQSLWFWFNATEDGFAATGGAFNDEDDVWVFYIDALPGCGQVTGGAASVALLPANDLRGLAGEPTINPCTGQVEPTLGPCRWVGGLGHELGHALGLPHPAGCESGSPDCPSNALMWLGYLTYPNTFLTATDQAILGQSAFIDATKLPAKVPACESIGSSAVTTLEATERLRVNFDRAAALGTCPYRFLLRASR
jgi:hypothetical protein